MSLYVFGSISFDLCPRLFNKGSSSLMRFPQGLRGRSGLRVRGSLRGGAETPPAAPAQLVVISFLRESELPEAQAGHRDEAGSSGDPPAAARASFSI